LNKRLRVAATVGRQPPEFGFQLAVKNYFHVPRVSSLRAGVQQRGAVTNLVLPSLGPQHAG
jgi:hypothetical protein